MATLTRPLTPDQRRTLAAMPAIEDSEFPRVRETIPAWHYTDPDRFDAEMRAVWRGRPVIVAPSAQLPEPKTSLAIDMAGMPVLLTRDRDGLLRAFANVCRHRGSRLCPSGQAQSGPRITCPYHAWTYGLDGALIGVPKQEIFPGLDKAEFHLAELPARESGGMIWVGLDTGRAFDFSDIEGQAEAELDALGLRDMVLFKHARFEAKANWKLIMDGMLDSYHVTRLHKDSVAKFFVDVENVIDTIGPHIRAAAGRGNFEKQRAETCTDFQDARQFMVFAYTMFPNGIIVVSPDFVSVGLPRPIAVDRTIVDYYMLTDTMPEPGSKAEDKLDRSLELMRTVFGEEDYWAAEQCHEGLASGTLDDVLLGGMEIQIKMFHDAVQAHIDRNGAGGPAQSAS